MKYPLSFLILPALILALCTHCNHVTSDPAIPAINPNLCKELAGSSYVPVTLGELLCVARDSTGVFYVIDKFNADYRCFISRNDTLCIKHVLGSGSVLQQYYFFSIQDGLQIIFQDSGGWKDVYICLQGDCSKCDSILSSYMVPGSRDLSGFALGWRDMCAYLENEAPNCHSLAAVTADSIAGLHLQNFPPTTRIEYLARLQDGNNLLVTTPANDWHGEAVVHYGMPDQLGKREVTRFVRFSDGGTTIIRFLVDSIEYEAYFGVHLDTTGISPGRTYLSIASDTLALERIIPTDEILNTLGLDCSQEIEF